MKVALEERTNLNEELKLAIRRLLVSAGALLLLGFGIVAHGQDRVLPTGLKVEANESGGGTLSWNHAGPTIDTWVMRVRFRGQPSSLKEMRIPALNDDEQQRQVESFSADTLESWLGNQPVVAGTPVNELVFAVLALDADGNQLPDTVQATATQLTIVENGIETLREGPVTTDDFLADADNNVFYYTGGSVEIEEGPLTEESLARVNDLLRSQRGLVRGLQKFRPLKYEVSTTLGDDVFTVASEDGAPVVSGTASAAVDYENANLPNPFEVTVTETTSGESTTVSVTVTDKNDAPHVVAKLEDGSPVIPNPEVYTIAGSNDVLPSYLITRYFDDQDEDSLTTKENNGNVPIECLSTADGSATGPTLVRTITNRLLVSHELTEIEGVSAGDYECVSLVEATDGKNSSATITLTVKVRVGVNNVPFFAGGRNSLDLTQAENESEALPAGIQVYDVDGDMPVATITGGASGIKGCDKDGQQIVAGGCLTPLISDSGIVTVTSTNLDFETNPVVKYGIKLTDKWRTGENNLPVTLTLTDANDPIVVPKEGKVPSVRVRKGETTRIDLVPTYFSDQDADSAITTICHSGDDNLTLVEVPPASVEVSAAAGGSSSLSCTARSGSDSAQVKIPLVLKGGENTDPAFVGGVEAVSYAIKEGRAGKSGMKVGSPNVAEDTDAGDPIRYHALGDPRFSAPGGQLTLNPFKSVDHESESVLNLMIKASDTWGGEDYLDVTVLVQDVNEPPTRTDVELNDVTLVQNGSTSIDVSDLFTDQDSIDQGRLIITARVANTRVATVDVDPRGVATISAGEQLASTGVVLTARDSGNHPPVTDTFSITVSANNPPTVANAIDDIEVHVGQLHDISLGSVFADADGEVNVTGASSSDESVALPILVDNMAGLVVVGRAVGSAEITVSAEDASGAGVSDTFTVTVSDSHTEGAPKLAGRIGNVTVTADVNEVTDLTEIFVANDASDVLTYSALNSNPEVLAVSFDHNQGTMTLMGQGPGSADLTVIATDQNGASIADTAVVSIETMPKAQGALAAVALELGLGGSVVDFGHAFIDEDGDMLSYEVRDLDSNVVEWNLMGTQLSLMPANGGSTVGLIVASDPAGRTAVQRLSVSVSDEAVKDVASRALAGFGQAVLNSSTDAIASRVVAERQSSDIGTTLSSLARQLDSTQNSNYATTSVATNNSVLNQPMNFSMNFGEGVQSWSMWSQTDSQTVGGEGATSDVNSLHLGVDLQASERWLVGLAVAQHVGASDFSFGNINATLDNELTTVLPYASFRPNSRSQVWTMAGVGRGETVIDEEDRNSLSMHIMAVGGRYELGRAGNINFAGRTDVAMATLETEQGTGISGGLSADLNRVRAGIESSMSFESDRGTVTPFLDVGLRRDGGTEFGHTGAEIAGGVKIETGALTLEAKGRLMAANGYDEDGFSVKATMNPSANGTGLSLSVEPRWGNSDMRDTFWSAQQQVNSLALNTGNSVRSEIGYGFLVDSDQMLVAPFARVDHSAESRTQTLFGARVNRSLDSGSMQFEAGVGSLENHSQGTVEAIAGVTARLQF